MEVWSGEKRTAEHAEECASHSAITLRFCDGFPCQLRFCDGDEFSCLCATCVHTPAASLCRGAMPVVLDEKHAETRKVGVRRGGADVEERRSKS
eukprot:2323895-Rhodomonas_salina.1